MRYLLSFLLILFSYSNSFAFSSAIQAVLASSASATDTCTSGLLFSWHGEDTTVTSGTPPGCSAGDTTATATQAAAISNTQYHDGSYSISIPTASDNYKFTASAGDIVKRTQGTITFWFYLSTTPTTNQVIIFVRDSVSGNGIQLGMYGTDNFKLRYVGNGTDRTAYTTTASLTTGTWYYVVGKWDINGATNKISITINGVTAVGTAAMNNMTNEPTEITFGDYYTNPVTAYYIDQIQIWDTWK